MKNKQTIIVTGCAVVIGSDLIRYFIALFITFFLFSKSTKFRADKTDQVP